MSLYKILHRTFNIVMPLCMAGLIMVGCHDKDGAKPDPRVSDSSAHTLLIYIAGDNSLYSMANANIDSCKMGMLKMAEPFNLVIFKDKTGELPSLFRLKYTEKGIVADTLRKWDSDIKSTDPTVLSEVIDYVFNQKFNTPIKGFELWSHGGSWIPGDVTLQFAANYAKPNPATYIGVDDTDFLEIWDLAHAIETTGIRFNYMLFDACNMATAEVAYELRNSTDYILGSLTEIMGSGYPYEMFVPTLASCQSENTLTATFSKLVKDFESKYGENGKYHTYGGTFSVIKTSAMPGLLTAFKTLCESHPKALDSLAAYAPQLYLKIQRYGRKLASSTNYSALYYDMGALAKFIDKDATVVQSYIQEAVVDEFHSSYFKQGNIADNYIALTDVCGLGISIPAFFNLYRYEIELTSAYERKCAWGKDLK